MRGRAVRNCFRYTFRFIVARLPRSGQSGGPGIFFVPSTRPFLARAEADKGRLNAMREGMEDSVED